MKRKMNSPFRGTEGVKEWVNATKYILLLTGILYEKGFQSITVAHTYSWLTGSLLSLVIYSLWLTYYTSLHIFDSLESEIYNNKKQQKS